MTSVTAAAQPLEDGEPTQHGAPNGRIIAIQLAALQALWLAAIAFGIYSIATA
jgi:nitroreductase